MSSPLLGIEYSKDGIRIVEASFGHRLEIRNSLSIDGAVPLERQREQLLHEIRTRGFQARKAVVAFGGPGIQHRLLTLPSLAPYEIDAMVASEVRKAGPDVECGYEVIDSGQAGARKTSVLLAIADAATVRQVRSLFDEHFQIVQFTTAAESLVNLLRNHGGATRETRGVVHFYGERCCIVVVDGERLVLSRDLQLDGKDQDDVDRLVTELRRSSLALQQDFPELHIEEILFSGDSPLLNAASQAVRERLGVESEILEMSESLETAGLRGDEAAFRSALPTFSVALGAAWRRKPGAGLNLTPGRPASPPKRRLAWILAPLAAGLVLAAAGYDYISKAQTETRVAQLQLKKDELLSVLTRAEEQSRLRARDTALTRQFAPEADWTELLRGLSLATPDSAVFESVVFDKQQRPRLLIRGSIVGTAASSAADFGTFLGSLRRLPGVINVNAGNPQRESDGTLIRFEVECELT